MTQDSENRSEMDWDQRFRDDTTPWERGSLHPAFRAWLEAGVIHPDRSLYIPGCGRSPEVADAARAGVSVTASDLSPTAMDWQKAQLDAASLSATLVCDDGLTWRPDVPFDVIYEQTFLCAIHPDRRVEYERMVHEALKPQGRLLVLFMQKAELGGPPYGCSPTAMRQLFPADRWVWPGEENFTPHPHPNLKGKPELAGILRRI